MKERFSRYSGNLYSRSNVDIVVDEARSYIRNSNCKYDLVQASLVDTWASTAIGAHSLSENYLYTIEAIAEYVDHLSDNGYLTISRWHGWESYKLVILYLKAAKVLNIPNVQKHIIVVKSLRSDQGSASIANIIFKKSEFTNDEIKNVLDLCKSLQFEICYVPNFVGNSSEYSKIVLCENLDEKMATTWRHLRPATDDSPFFFNWVYLESVSDVLLGAASNAGIFLLYGLFFISIFLTLTFIILPNLLARRDIQIRGNITYLLYFSILGLSFMMVESSLLQKFMIFLGHPVYSTTVIISTILLFAGIGSLLSNRFHEDRLFQLLKKVVIITTGIMILYDFSLYPLFNSLLGLNINARILISIILLSGLGIFMGMPFPLGIRILGSKNRTIIPFCWALNGAFSVLGSIVAVILSMNTGFTQTILFAASLYFVAYLIIARAAT